MMPRMEGGAGIPERVRTRVRAGARRAWWLTEKAVGGFFSDHCQQLAAGIAFFALFSMFPLAIVLTAVFGLFLSGGTAEDEVVNFLVERLPLEEGGGDDLRSVLDDVAGSAGAVGAAGLLALAYTSSALMAAIRNSLNAIWRLPERRAPLRGKALDIALVLGLGVLFLLSLVIALIEGVAADVGRDIGVPETLLDGSLSFVGTLAPLLLAGGVFTVLLVVVPARPQRLRDLWPGILVATAGYALVQVGFSFYLENFSRYSAVYGSLGAIVAFMVFVYVAAMAFLLGAEYARCWPAVRARPADSDDGGGSDEPLGRRIWGLLKRLVVNPGRDGDRDRDAQEP